MVNESLQKCLYFTYFYSVLMFITNIYYFYNERDISLISPQRDIPPQK